MSVFVAVMLGLLQGLTEFFPISSSGHLALFGHWFGMNEPDLIFDILVHLATLAAIILYFRKDLLQLILLVFKGERGDLPKGIIPFLILGTIPAGLVGVFLKQGVTWFHAHSKAVGLLLLLNAVILLLGLRHVQGEKPFAKLRWQEVLAVGCAQACAILPGISRSGSTIMAGLFLGFQKEAAARFSFLLAIPAIAGAGLLAAKDLITGDAPFDASLWAPYIAGFITALVSGFVALAFLMKLLEGRRFFLFGFYCIFLGIMGLIF